MLSGPAEIPPKHFCKKSGNKLVCDFLVGDVRFGSKADICGATSHVRFTPNSDRKSGLPQKVSETFLVGHPIIRVPRRFVEAIAVIFRFFFFEFRFVPNRHVIEQLANQTKRVHDVIVFAGGETQEL